MGIIDLKTVFRTQKYAEISIRCKIVYVIFIIFVPWDESIYQYLVNQLNQPWNKVKRMAKHIPFVQNFT
jgi:uncharacterized protein YqhQ